MCDLLLIINKTQYIFTLNFALQCRKISITGRDLYWWYWDFKSDHMWNIYVLSKYHNRHMQQPNFLRRNLLVQHSMNQKKYNPTLNNLFEYIRSNINSYHLIICFDGTTLGTSRLVRMLDISMGVIGNRPVRDDVLWLPWKHPKGNMNEALLTIGLLRWSWYGPKYKSV